MKILILYTVYIRILHVFNTIKVICDNLIKFPSPENTSSSKTNNIAHSQELYIHLLNNVCISYYQYIFTFSVWVHPMCIFWVQVVTPPEAMQINDDLSFCVVHAYN